MKKLGSLGVPSDVHIEAVNHEKGVAVLSNGVTVPIVSYLDKNGEECYKEDATVFCCGNDEQLYRNGFMKDYGPVTCH